jgi:hypothetical protein
MYNNQTCQSESDCTGVSSYVGVGHCVSAGASTQCSYDTCLADTDCGSGPTVCLCQGDWSVWSGVAPGNNCATGTCRDDSDCPGSVCSPSVAPEGVFYGLVGYFCHTPKDQCQCDEECAARDPAVSSCAYNPQIGAWACSNRGGAG